MRAYLKEELEQFLQAVDAALERRVEVILIGGAAAALHYGATSWPWWSASFRPRSIGWPSGSSALAGETPVIPIRATIYGTEGRAPERTECEHPLGPLRTPPREPGPHRGARPDRRAGRGGDARLLSPVCK
jgi:hypothetical protein